MLIDLKFQFGILWINQTAEFHQNDENAHYGFLFVDQN